MVASGAGGVQQTIAPYCDALLAAGNEVQAVLYRKSPMIGDIRSLGVEPDLVAFPCQNRIMTRLTQFMLRRKLDAFRPDIIIGFAGRGYPEARRAMGRSIPIITRVASLKKKAISKLIGADGFLVTSAQMKTLLETYGVTPGNVRIVPNFLRRPLAIIERKTMRLPPTIGSMGRLMDDKGFDILLKALSVLKEQGVDFRARIGGDGEDMAALRQQVRELKLEGLVEFPGWIGNGQKAEFLNALDIFVCPSRYEPFGIVMLEAMEAGLPLVASETTGSIEIIEDGRTGIRVPNMDHLAMAEALKRLIDNPQEAQRMAKAAARQLKERFHISSAGRVLAGQVADLKTQFEEHRKNKAK